MFSVPLVTLLFLTWCTGANSQLTLTQPPSASVSPGNIVKISCIVSMSDRAIRWYQQKPGNAPRYLLYYYTDSNKHQGSGVPSRFSGSKDSSGSNHFLTISGAQADDEGVYYCAGWHNDVCHSVTASCGSKTKTSARILSEDMNSLILSPCGVKMPLPSFSFLNLLECVTQPHLQMIPSQ